MYHRGHFNEINEEYEHYLDKQKNSIIKENKSKQSKLKLERTKSSGEEAVLVKKKTPPTVLLNP